MRQRKCEIVGCHFWGNSPSMETHNKEHAQKHVDLLLEERGKLQDALLNKVSKVKYLYNMLETCRITIVTNSFT